MRRVIHFRVIMLWWMVSATMLRRMMLSVALLAAMHIVTAMVVRHVMIPVLHLTHTALTARSIWHHGHHLHHARMHVVEQVTVECPVAHMIC